MIYKIRSVVNYILNMLILLLGFLTAPIVFPFVYYLRDYKVFKKGLIWLYMDDEDGMYGAKYWRQQKNLKDKSFWTAYRWCALRNPAWNLHTLISPPHGESFAVDYSGELTKDNEISSIYSRASIHFVDDDGKWTFNVGKNLSIRHSTLGDLFLWFYKGGNLYFRWTFAKRLKGKYWISGQIGTTDRHLFKLKIKKIEKIIY